MDQGEIVELYQQASIYSAFGRFDHGIKCRVIYFGLRVKKFYIGILGMVGIGIACMWYGYYCQWVGYGIGYGYGIKSGQKKTRSNIRAGFFPTMFFVSSFQIIN